jgi:ABC-type multidrug transport system ATPase subunit/peptidoglycan/LPS O-acetylase OafA/YrhL
MAANERLHSLDAVRAFALLLGVALHASLSFVPGMPPGTWAMVDNSPSAALGQFFFISHIFRMSLFFVVAGFFARLLYHRVGAQGFLINRAKRIAVPLIVGWCIVFPSIALVWGWGLSKVFAGVAPAAGAGFTPPEGYFPLTHLWFLYYLLLLYPIVLVLRALLVKVDDAGTLRARIDGLTRGALSHRGAVLIAPVVFGAPLAAVLFNLPTWNAFGGIPTPDSTLTPQLPALVAYGTAMTVGWLLHRQLPLLQGFERRWLAHLVVAIGATVFLSLNVSPSVLAAPAQPGFDKALLSSAYVFALWSWNFAIIGFGLRFLSAESAVRRYIADSSYWLYLAHLPVVAAFGVIVGHWPLHWSVKFPLVLAASFAVLFASYHYLVRSTVLGQWLNGKRYPRKRVVTVEREVSVGSVQADASDVVAELEGVTRFYGKTVALDTVDLSIRRGELLTLLGPNGAGKTSAIALWLGLAEPDGGVATLMGGSPLDVERRRSIGVMMQDVTLMTGMKVRELIDQTAAYYPDPMSVDEAMALTLTTALGSRVYDKLSGGQKRQVQFALAIVGRPAVIFLDEPSVGLDISARENLWMAIRKLRDAGCSILLTTHYLEEAEALADRVVVLAKGRVVATGTVNEVRAVVSRRHIRCDSELSISELQAWPGVVSVSRIDRRLTILATDAETVLRRLLASDQRIANLEVQQAGLAEAFVELTKEAA